MSLQGSWKKPSTSHNRKEAPYHDGTSNGIKLRISEALRSF
jgi:hypothetical protein